MRVGFLGAGVMGAGMVTNLLKAGHEVRVYNRTPARLEPLVRSGARAAATPAEAAQGAEVVASCVTDTAAVRAVWLGEAGALAAAPPGAVAVDLSTVGPAAAREIAQACADRQIAFLDAPVTGGEAGAREGSLTVFVGGEGAALERARPFFDAIARVVHAVGPVGAGQAVKLIQNLVGGLNLAAAAEGYALALALGLDGERVLEMLGATTSQSRSAEILLDRVRSGRTEPGFSLANRLKDFVLALDMAHAAACPLPLTAAGSEMFWQAAAQGMGELDQTVVRAVAGRGERAQVARR